MGGRFGEKRGTRSPPFCFQSKTVLGIDGMCWPDTLMPGPKARFPSIAFEAHRDGVMRSGVHLVKRKGGS